MKSKYQTRHGAAAPPSGGVVSRPILGMGRLPPGTYAVEVLSLTQERRPTLIVQAINQHCHAETVEWQLCLTGIVAGDKLNVSIVARQGYVVERDGGAYRARDADTGAALGDWRPDLAAVATAMQVRSIPPADTFIATIQRRGEDAVHTLATPAASNSEATLPPSIPASDPD